MELVDLALDSGNTARHQFGLHAENYRKSRTHADSTTLNYIIELISPRIKEKGLDVGCGGGHMATTLSAEIKELVAVDITPEMLVQTRTLAVEKKISNLRLCLSDAQNLSFQSNVFDVVSCRIVFHHILEPVQALTEIKRVLKKNGRVFIQDILGSDDRRTRDYVDIVERLRDPSHIKNYNREEWKNYLQAVGLNVIHSEVVSGLYQLKEWTTRSGTPVDQVEKIEKMLKNMPKDIAEHLQASYTQGDWVIHMQYILLLAKKI